MIAKVNVARAVTDLLDGLVMAGGVSTCRMRPFERMIDPLVAVNVIG